LILVYKLYNFFKGNYSNLFIEVVEISNGSFEDATKPKKLESQIIHEQDKLSDEEESKTIIFK
jgi:hypothetical protein